MPYRDIRRNFPETRFKHCYKVGQTMEYIAKKYYGYDDKAASEMFVLGYLHDSMYDYESDETLHNEIVAKYLPEQYRQDVLHHSTYQTGYSSDALDMLYFADQIVDGSGKICSFDERIADILNRHGTGDGVYKDTVDIVDYLKSKELFLAMEQDVCSNEKLKSSEIPVETMAQTWMHTVKVGCEGNPGLYLSMILSGADNGIFDENATKFSKQIQRQLSMKMDFGFLAEPEDQDDHARLSI